MASDTSSKLDYDGPRVRVAADEAVRDVQRAQRLLKGAAERGGAHQDGEVLPGALLLGALSAEGEIVGTNFERKFREEGRTFHAMTLLRR